MTDLIFTSSRSTTNLGLKYKSSNKPMKILKEGKLTEINQEVRRVSIFTCTF